MRTDAESIEHLQRAMMSIRKCERSELNFKAGVSGRHARGLILGFTRLCALVLLAGFVSVWLGQDANWDLQNYHLYNAFVFLTHRYALDPGATPQWYLNPLLDVPYYLITQYLSEYPRVVAFIQGMSTGVVWFLLWEVFKAATPAEGGKYRVIRIIAWVTACSGTMLISETGTTFNDIQVNILTLISLLCIVRYTKEPSKTGHLLLGYFIIGVATGLKLTGAIYLIAALISLPLVTRRVRPLTGAALATACGVALSGGWWALYLQLHYSSPLFPFYNNFFRSDWWPPIGGSDTRFLPKDLIQWLIYPAFWVFKNKDRVTEVPFADGRMFIGLLSALVIGAAFCADVVRARIANTTSSIKTSLAHRDVGFLCVFFFTSYLVWLKEFSVYRYGVTLECLSPVLVFIIVARILPNYGKVGRVSIVMCGCVLIIVMACTRYPNWMRAGYSAKILSVETTLKYNGATILAAAGNPPVSYLITQLQGTAHFITVSDGFRDTKLFQQQTQIINRSDDIYVIEEDGFASYLPGLLRSYWGLVPSSAPCVKITANIGGPFRACRFNHSR